MLQKCYEEGRRAAFDGFPLSHNRYTLHTAASREWERGWWDAGEEMNRTPPTRYNFIEERYE